MEGCQAFRDALAGALSTGGAHSGGAGVPGAPGRVAELGWHEHLLSCDECRSLLASEEALDVLLASLPEPRLPADLAARVLERLVRQRAAGDEALEALLGRDPEPEVPGGLAARVLAGLAPSRAEAGVPESKPDPLDALLDRVPAPSVPEGLAERVLAGTRAPETPILAGPGSGGRWRLAAAAVLVLSGSVWLAWLLGDRRELGTGRERETAELPVELRLDPAPDRTELASGDPPGGPDVAAGDVDPELLAALDVLEDWEALTSDDLDLLLGELDALDWALLEHADEVGLGEDEG